MAGNPLRLLDWRLPPARQRYTRRDTAFYALSLGVGADPLDLQQRALVDPWGDALQALPSMALVLGYPGFWLGRQEVAEAAGVAPWQVLHAEQSVRLEAALPVECEVIGETRVTALVDKGAARGSLLYSERGIREAASGRLLATCSQVHFLRDVGGFGSGGKAPAAAPGSSLPQGDAMARIDTPTLPQQALLYRLNGDANALHFDPAVAERAGFPRPILHGMCSVGMAVVAACRALGAADPAKVRGFGVRMSSPVLPGDTLRTSVWADGRFHTEAVERGQTVLGAGWVEVVESGP